MIRFDRVAWLRDTAISFRRREPELLLVDKCLNEHLQRNTSISALDLNDAIIDYKKAIPGWEASQRNRTEVMTKMFKLANIDIAQYLDRSRSSAVHQAPIASMQQTRRRTGATSQGQYTPPNLSDCLWSPLHEEKAIKDAAISFIKELKLHKVWQGDKRDTTDLSQFSPNSTIYLLAHGNAEMPVFTINKVDYTVQRFVELMIEDKVRLDHRNFTMLVCYSGASVNTEAAADLLLRKKEQFEKDKISVELKIQQQKKTIAFSSTIDKLMPEEKNLSPYDPGDKKVRKMLEDQQAKEMFDEHPLIKNSIANYGKLTNESNSIGHRAPAMFESFTEQGLMEKQLLPLAARLSAEMKAKGFTNFALRSFKGPVVNQGINGGICLNLEDQQKRNEPLLASLILPLGVKITAVPIELIPNWEVTWR